MAILVKPGVQFTFAPGGFRILEALKHVSGDLNVDLTITSGADGIHSPNSKHYSGEAYDVRSKDLTKEMKHHLVFMLQSLLGPRFYVFLEVPDTDNEHIHCQTRRNSTYSMLDYLKEGF